MANKRGRPKGTVGTGIWGRALMEMATIAAESGKPIVPLVPKGSPKRMRLGLTKAATPLVRAGKILRFKLPLDEAGRRFRTYICLPDAQFPDGSPVREQVELAEVGQQNFRITESTKATGWGIIGWQHPKKDKGSDGDTV